jgi:hypothetical protein
VEADFFHEKRANVLPGEYGIGVGLVNAGIITNRGVDLTIRSSRHFAKTGTST